MRNGRSLLRVHNFVGSRPCFISLWCEVVILGLFLVFGMTGRVSAADVGEGSHSKIEERLARQIVILEGRFVYERHCQLCHGRQGDGRGKWAASLEPRPRSFRDAQFKYRSTRFGKLPVEADLKDTVRGGRSNTAMGMFSKLSDRQVNAVVAYVQTFSSKWKDPSWRGPSLELPPEPDWVTNPEGLIKRVQQGQSRFVSLCAPCHGEGADGTGPQAASLEDFKGRPMKPANLLSAHLRCGDEDEDLVRLIMTGMNGTPMLGFADVLSGDEIWELVVYLKSLRDQAHPE